MNYESSPEFDAENLMYTDAYLDFATRPERLFVEDAIGFDDILGWDEPVTDMSQEPSINGLTTYRSAINRFENLSQDEQNELITVAQAGNSAAARLFDEKLTSAEKAEYERIAETGLEALNTVWLHNLRFVPFILNKKFPAFMTSVNRSALNRDDIIQAGNEGLRHAILKYNLEHSSRVKFLTYASHRIFQSAWRTIENTGSTMRLPSHMHTELKDIKTANSELFGGEGTVNELANATDIAPKTVELLWPYIYEFESLEDLKDAAAISSAEQLEFDSDNIDSLEEAIMIFDRIDERYPTITDAENVGLHAALHKGLEYLGERPRAVLTMRFGLDGNIPMTLDDTGRVLGITRERVRQIESKALAKMRHPDRSSPLLSFTEPDRDIDRGVRLERKRQQREQESAREQQIVQSIRRKYEGWLTDDAYHLDTLLNELSMTHAQTTKQQLLDKGYRFLTSLHTQRYTSHKTCADVLGSEAEQLQLLRRVYDDAEVAIGPVLVKSLNDGKPVPLTHSVGLWSRPNPDYYLKNQRAS